MNPSAAPFVSSKSHWMTAEEFEVAWTLTFDGGPTNAEKARLIQILCIYYSQFSLELI